MENTIKYDVFISYSSDDQIIAEGVCGFLESNGIRCFIAYRDITPTEPWPAVIPYAIESSRLMVAIFSDRFNISKQTDRELTIASDALIPILTFKISNSIMTGAKKYFLTNLHWLDAFPNPEQHFGPLLKSVQLLLNKPDNKETENIVRNNTTCHDSCFYFISNELPDLSEPNRHAVYDHYFPMEKTTVFFEKSKNCLNEMYAFHSHLGLETDKREEDHFLAEWIINNNRIKESLLNSLIQSYGESITDCLAHAIYDYRTGKYKSSLL